MTKIVLRISIWRWWVYPMACCAVLAEMAGWRGGGRAFNWLMRLGIRSRVV